MKIYRCHLLYKIVKILQRTQRILLKVLLCPASDNNNAIFKHWYDATIDNTFDARIKVGGRIELDGVPFRQGKWRLSKVKV